MIHLAGSRSIVMGARGLFVPLTIVRGSVTLAGKERVPKLEPGLLSNVR
jgi:hypothetical protein